MKSEEAIIYFMVHKPRKEIARLVLPHWRKYGFPVIVFTPRNSPVPPDGDCEQIVWGNNGSSGQPMYHRILFWLEHFLQSSAQFTILAEYDCICLLDTIRFRKGLHGSGVHGAPKFRPPEETPYFMAERYVSAPFMLDRRSAAIMFDTAKTYPEVTEQGHPDRLVSALAILSGVPVLAHPEGSLAPWLRNPEELDEYYKQLLNTALQRGDRWIHMVKTPEQLEFLLEQSK